MSWLKSTGEVIGFLLLTVAAIVESIVRMFIPRKYRQKDIAGEIVLITGAAGGLGRCIAQKMAQLGAIVVLWDVNKQGLDELVKMIKSTGGTCYGYVCDLSDREDIYKKAAILNKEVGRVSILVNNAGVAMGKRFLDLPDEMIIRTMDVNVMSHFWTVKAFLPAMLEENKGHIVSIASVAGLVGCPRLIDYCSSKFASVGFNEALQMELEADGYDIKTTLVCPYFIKNTGMFDEVTTRLIPKLSPNEVADRVIAAIRCNEKFAIVPSYLQVMPVAKWMLPWKCKMLITNTIFQVAAPPVNGVFPHTTTITARMDSGSSSQDKPSGVDGIHQQLARRVSSFERKP